jgi:uncharacterized phage protein (TIGR02218 family)
MIIKTEEDLLNFQQLILCFKLTLKSGDEKYLTNINTSITINNITYLPNSGLSLLKVEFSSDENNVIELRALYEDKGIMQNDKLLEAYFEIFILQENNLKEFAKYYCTKVIEYQYGCVIYLEAITMKLKQNIVEYYSKTCRVSFASKKCGIDVTNYTDIVKPLSIEGNIVTFCDNNKVDGYYTYGFLYIGALAYKARIIKHRLNILELSDNIKVNSLEEIGMIEITSGCDKHFNTCCNKFNNAVNFRGEPFIPKLVNNYGKFNF